MDAVPNLGEDNGKSPQRGALCEFSKLFAFHRVGERIIG